jgi:anthranilate synthase/aminodeoxychorismate synthase-like glutamine amidotransferase
VVAAKRLMHGKTSAITGDGKGVFAGIKQHFQAMRYHSLAVEKESLPDCLAVTATSEDGEIMGLRHRSHTTEGIQFHPESIMTPLGKRLLRNFIKIDRFLKNKKEAPSHVQSAPGSHYQPNRFERGPDGGDDV